MQGKIVAALLAVAPFAAASPINVKRNVQFSIDQVAGPKMPKSGAAALQKALGKYKAPIPGSVSSAAAAQQSGSVGASPEQYDQEYLCPVSIGSPAQVLNLDFDTGSSDLWVFSSETPQSSSQGHSIYTPSKSSSSKKQQGESWSIQYGDGSTSAGDVYADVVVVGEVTATTQIVEAATSVAAQFAQDTQNDGLLGLGFSNINTVQPKQATTFFDTVKATLDEALFTCTLKHGEPGSYDFGYIDDSKYSGDITYVDIDSSNGWYQFDAGEASANGQSLGTIGSSIADTGTSLILVGDDILQAYYGSIDGASNNQQAGGWVVPCSGNPDFDIAIGDATFSVAGDYIAYADNGDGTCYGGLQSSQGVGVNILGDVFLKNFFMVFDSGNSRLGVAKQA